MWVGDAKIEGWPTEPDLNYLGRSIGACVVNKALGELDQVSRLGLQHPEVNEAQKAMPEQPMFEAR